MPNRPSIVGRFLASNAGSYGRIPQQVILDAALSDRDVRVYCALALVERDGVVNCGSRKLAQLCAMTKSTIHRRIANLAARGHISVETPVKTGQRSVYRLTAPIFETATLDASKPAPRPKPKREPCLKCGLRCVRHKLTGWCRKCISAAREDARQAGLRRIAAQKAMQA